jgi:menaquinone-9 beta-reductase
MDALKEKAIKDIVIIGGGLAGLVNAIRLSSAGLNVMLVEKKSYPFHRVCGEYISNEVRPFLDSIGADIPGLKPSTIKRLLISAASGSLIETKLEQGGFGISRYQLDHHLYRLALRNGVEFRFNTQAIDVKCKDKIFKTSFSEGPIVKSHLVIGAFGKRSSLDRAMKRDFFYMRSPYIGVKYHIRSGLPADQISLHNFKGGYCGIVKIEEDKYCMCYLSKRENLQEHGNIAAMEEKVLWKNPVLKEIFLKAEFIHDKPEVINEISFEKKNAVENHILMSGDSAGMITPLCGNGMAMAIHSAKILSGIILENYKGKSFDLTAIEEQYSDQWEKMFARRLSRGRFIQNLMLRENMSAISIGILKRSEFLTSWLIRQTHGQPF